MLGSVRRIQSGVGAVEKVVGSGEAMSIARYQTARRAILAVLVVAAMGMLVFVGSVHDELTHERIETLGLVLIVIGIGGRLWATLYIGGRKASEVVSTGPYSVTRNPLYLFSSIAAAGVGAQTGSYTVACLFMLTTAALFHVVALREERFLAATLGDLYLAYKARVPRFWPNPFLYRDAAEVTFQTRRLRVTLLDGLMFLLAIPVLEAIETAQDSGAVQTLVKLF
jgi:protein-S-isoprenylcysteine O-methyltransferase Ste14